MKIDKEIIQGKIDIIEQNLTFLKEIGETNYKIFKGDYKNILATKHALQESIEACLDIANHIISSLGYRRAEDYSDMFRVLMENSIITEELTKKLIKMAKFRNLLVHRYAIIENQRIYTIARENLEDIREFVKSVLAFLSNLKKT